MPKTIKVLVVDDSALVREILSKMLSGEKDIEVTGTAADPLFAIKKIRENKPDVITLDLEMPRMDGLTFLKKLMNVYPLPVVVVSSLTQEGNSATIRALELGATDFVSKPKAGIGGGLAGMASEILEKVRAAANVNMERLRSQARQEVVRETSLFKKETGSATDEKDEVVARSTDRIVAIGASTGGTVAVKQILRKLPANMPGMIIVLHMPPGFTSSYAQSLNATCRLKAKEAQNGDLLSTGCAYIAPGGRHLLLRKNTMGFSLKTDDSPPVNRHKPSVDKTLFSVAEKASPNCMGIILTGMGEDGARGLKEMHDRGSFTVVQDEKSSVVYGMPQKAISLGGVDRVLSLDEIPKAIMRFIQSERLVK